ncbi:DUF2889 domain-containing protein [Acidocella sp.]|uniref:DUF2889 domain-containing protein n=1 Tax=Acidocella sp. TaxID=50710 RepID=UPI00262B4384|nr:DUF2889 domain-containing protein [Acidocella sp.]
MSVSGETLLPPPPKTPAGHAPPRLAGSVRRTSSIDVDWPEGRFGAMHLVGRARDVFTPGGKEIEIFDEGAFEASIDAERRLLSLSATPAPPGLQVLVGERAGGHLRGAIDRALPEERRNGTPLHLILDDIAGSSLVSPWAWSRWDPQWLEQLMALKADPKFAAAFNRENICSGLRTGSSGLSLAADGVDAGVLRDPADPQGWHEFPDAAGPGMRRARRIDVWRDTLIHIDAHFQDSATMPDGGRAALHEYRICATADPVSLALLSVEAEPRVLPFAECPAAAANAGRMVGKTLGELREAVLDELRGVAGCTHLNDALRALADVPLLLRFLERLP